MSSRHQKYYENLDKISKEENVSTRVANDVLYLREQPHHNPEMERQFIEKAKKGDIPDVLTYGREPAKKG